MWKSMVPTSATASESRRPITNYHLNSMWYCTTLYLHVVLQSSDKNPDPETKEKFQKIVAASGVLKRNCHPSASILHLCSKMSSLRLMPGSLLQAHPCIQEQAESTWNYKKMVLFPTRKKVKSIEAGWIGII